MTAVSTDSLAAQVERDTADLLSQVDARLANLRAWSATLNARRAWQAAADAERRQRGRPVAPVGMLAVWRRELRAGQRTRTTFDATWRAACAEADALERGTR